MDTLMDASQPLQVGLNSKRNSLIIQKPDPFFEKIIRIFKVSNSLPSIAKTRNKASIHNSQQTTKCHHFPQISCKSKSHAPVLIMHKCTYVRDARYYNPFSTYRKQDATNSLRRQYLNAEANYCNHLQLS